MTQAKTIGLHKWTRLRNDQARRIETIKDPRERIDQANQAEEHFKRLGDPSWTVGRSRWFAEIRVKAKREIRGKEVTARLQTTATAVAGLEPDAVYDTIRTSGGIYIRPGMDAHTEWIEGLDVGMRRALGSSSITASTLDEWGSELGLSSNKLLATLQKATIVGDRESPQMIERALMEHYGIDPETGEDYPEEDVPSLADINSATKDELQSIQGIGPKLSTLIVKNQPFYAINKGVFRVSNLRGIGKAKIRRILEYYEVAEVVPF